MSAEEEERFSGDMTLKKGFNNDETEDHSVSKAPANHPIPSTSQPTPDTDENGVLLLATNPLDDAEPVT